MHSSHCTDLCAGALSWWNRIPFVNFLGCFGMTLVLTFQSLELLIQCVFILKEAMQLVSGNVEFNACQVSLLRHNFFLLSLWAFQPILVVDITFLFSARSIAYTCINSHITGKLYFIVLIKMSNSSADFQESDASWYSSCHLIIYCLLFWCNSTKCNEMKDVHLSTNQGIARTLQWHLESSGMLERLIWSCWLRHACLDHMGVSWRANPLDTPGPCFTKLCN